MSSVAIARPRPLVLGDLIAQHRGRAAQVVRDVLLVVGAAGFVGALAQISIHLSFTPVPITGQTLGVLLAGTALGWRRAAASMALYAIAGVAGVPWFAGATSGYVGASFGYIVGFFFAAAACGYLAERGARPVGAAVSARDDRRRDHHLRLRPDLAGPRPAPERGRGPRGRIHAVRGGRRDQGRHRRRPAAGGVAAGSAGAARTTRRPDSRVPARRWLVLARRGLVRAWLCSIAGWEAFGVLRRTGAACYHSVLVDQGCQHVELGGER